MLFHFVEKGNGEFGEMNIMVNLFPNTILCQIRGDIIELSKVLARANDKLEKKLTDKISNIEIEIDNLYNYC